MVTYTALKKGNEFMGMNKELLANISNQYIESWYRFQGGNSFEHLDIRSQKPFNASGGYVYFSKSNAHHKYFIAKRFKQIVNKLLQEHSELVLTRKNLLDNATYDRISNIVSSNALEIGDMHSIKIIYCKPFEDLVNQNYVLNMDKKGYKM